MTITELLKANLKQYKQEKAECPCEHLKALRAQMTWIRARVTSNAQATRNRDVLGKLIFQAQGFLGFDQARRLLEELHGETELHRELNRGTHEEHHRPGMPYNTGGNHAGSDPRPDAPI